MKKRPACPPDCIAPAPLSVAYDVDDAAALRRLADYQRNLGLDVEVLSGREARKREPLLATGVSGGVWVPGDHSVDNGKQSPHSCARSRSPASQ